MTVAAMNVALDYDGVLHPYTRGWLGPVPDDEPPAAEAVVLLRSLVRLGYRVVLFSARAADPEGLAGIVAWLERYGLTALVDRVTAIKPPAVAYVDDRAVAWRGTASEALDAVRALAAQLDGQAATAICTSREALWCPVHGDCTCAGTSSAGCPLHGEDSAHGSPTVAEEHPHG